MSIKKILFSLLTVTSMGFAASAQDQHCGNVVAEKQLLEKNPQLIAPIQQLEEYLNSIDLTKLERNKRGDYIINLVYHVLHNYGSENISDQQIFSDVKALNENYNKKNADTIDVVPAFQNLIANVGFEFKLANRDPEGNCTNGIDRINTYKTYFANDQSKLNQWNRSVYFNIWVAHTLENVQAAAYAYKPPTAHNMFWYDGVISRHNYIGSMGTSQPNYSKTTTHEIGHCLNLDHTWGSTNQPTVACGDDGVQDTPETKGHNTCSAAALADQFCNPGIIENTQNYMEYSYCDIMFTPGQADRMLAALTSPIAQRSSLISAQSQHFAGTDQPKMDCAPKADFTSNKQFTCVGNPVNFVNKSYNDTTVTASAWDFGAGATPATSNTISNISPTYSSTGWKTISLTATSNAGSGSTVKNNYVYVADNVGKQIVGQVNMFEDEAAFNNNWANFNYFNNQFKWQYYNLGGYLGSKCIRYRGFDDRTFPQNLTGSAASDIDELITEAYDLSSLNVNNAYLNFFLSGATRASINADIADSLVILYSNNCGSTWVNWTKITKTALINNGTINTEFNADNNAVWMAKSFPLPQAALTSSTFFKFRYKPCDFSNNVYIDNLEINSTPVSVKNLNAVGFDFEVVPNPANSFSAIHLNSSENADVKILVTNLLGDKVCSFSQKVLSGTINKIELPSNVFNNKGIYFVNIDINGKKSTKKLVIQ